MTRRRADFRATARRGGSDDLRNGERVGTPRNELDDDARVSREAMRLGDRAYARIAFSLALSNR